MARGPLAGASGPGKFSKRTDMSLGSTSYGEGAETAALNTAAPKSKTRGVADDVGGRPANPLTPVTPLFAPSQRPDELSDVLAEMIPYDTTGEIQYLYQNALSRGN